APPAVADGLALAVGGDGDVAPRLGHRARHPRRWRARRRRRGGLAPRAAGEEGQGGDPRAGGARAPGGHRQPSLMSAVPSYLPPWVSRKVTLSGPGSVARNAKAKNGFSLIDWVVSNDATSLPR